jgi:hypothetical protein
MRGRSKGKDSSLRRVHAGIISGAKSSDLDGIARHQFAERRLINVSTSEHLRYLAHHEKLLKK